MKKYKSYSTYKHSGVEWLGDIPKHWQLRRLKFVCTVNPPKSEISSLQNDIEVSFCPMELVGNGTISTESKKLLGEVRQGFTYFRDGDVVIAKISPSFENGKGAIASNLVNGLGFGTTELHILRPSYCINRSFLYYLTISYIFRNIGAGQMYGVAGQQRIPNEFLNNFPTPFPPLTKEQESIANFLDRETTRIDTLITKKRELINLLHHKHTIIITNAVTKGIEPNVLMKDSGVAWIGEIPKHWQVKRIKFVCRLETGHTPNRSEESYWIEEECTIPWVSLNDTKTLAVLDYISETQYNISPTGMANSSAHLIEPGAVVFTRDATIGLAAITTKFMAVSQHIIAWVCLSDIHNRFLLHIIYAMNNELERLTMGSTIKTIGIPDIKNLRMPIPPLEEQVKIIDKLNKKKQMIEKAIVKIEEQINELCNKRQALITDAVTGKIDVREEVERGTA
jgi:type I restriction enzyme S subunit